MTIVNDPAPHAAPTAPDAAAPTAAGGGAVDASLPIVRARTVPSDAVVHAEAVTVQIAGHVLLPPIDLRVAAGETVAIVGRSGTGKTTLLHVIAGLIAPTSGTVAASDAALMPQHDGLMAWATAADNAALPLRITGMPRRHARAAARQELAALGLADHADRRVARLSGGQRQRVALARTLLADRQLLLLDEPFAAVDALTRDDLHATLLAHLGRARRSALLVTHDIDEAVRLADRILVLGSTGLVEPSQRLVGCPGDRLAARGGEPLRDAIYAELSR